MSAKQYKKYFYMLDKKFDKYEGIADLHLSISEDEKEILLRVMALSKELGYRYVDAVGVPRDCVQMHVGNERFIQQL